MVFTPGLKYFNYRMSQDKNLFHTNSVFLQSQQCIMNMKIFNSSLGIIILNLVKMANVWQI